jgi:hypothetical protein
MLPDLLFIFTRKNQRNPLVSSTIKYRLPRNSVLIRLYLVFIYTCPSSSKIRERMLYSSSKAGVITAAENEASVTVIKKVFN